MACYSVLRIGPLIDDNALRLRSAISSHFEASTSTKSEGAPHDLITISNRYFDAPILFKGLHESVPVDITNALIQEDGIILVFNAAADALPSQSFDSLQSIHSSAETDDKAGELLRLCIGIAIGPSPLSDGTKKSEEEYSRRVLWCLDRGYEYVEVDLSDEGMQRGHEERDKEGFARVVEAIESCMWSSHVMKPRGGAAAVKNLESTTPTTAPDVNEDTKSEQHIKADVSTRDSTDDDATREAAAVASLMNEVKEIQPQDNLPEAENRQQEIAFHELEQVMTEAKRIREASQSDSMTDEERRQRAGDTAVRLMGLLEKLGFDDSEDREDDSDVDVSEAVLTN
jgi:hypothetical protein